MSQIDNKLMSREEQNEAGKELKRQQRQREFLETGDIPGSSSEGKKSAQSASGAADELLTRNSKGRVSKSRLGRHRKEAPFGLRIAIGVKEVIDLITLGFFSPLTNFIMAIYVGIMFLIGDEELKNFLKKRIFLPMILEFIPIISAMPWYIIFVFGIKPKSD